MLYSRNLLGPEIRAIWSSSSWNRALFLTGLMCGLRGPSITHAVLETLGGASHLRPHGILAAVLYGIHTENVILVIIQSPGIVHHWELF